MAYHFRFFFNGPDYSLYLWNVLAGHANVWTNGVDPAIYFVMLKLIINDINYLKICGVLRLELM